MDKVQKELLCAVGISVLINVILPQLAMHIATEDEISPPEGAANLDMKSQIMHMLVHHGQVPVSSSVVVAIIVAVSVLLGKELCKLLEQ